MSAGHVVVATDTDTDGDPTGRYDIRARRVSFDWAATPVGWIPGDPQTAHTIDVLHLLLPAGERWFVHVFRQALPEITDDALRADVRGFMGQESVHSRAHAGVLDHLAAQGVDTDAFTVRIDDLFEKLLGDRPFGRDLGPRARRQWLLQRLAIIAAIEHYTSVMGNWVLDSPALDAAGADPVMLDLLRWHGAEEVEHRSVAFDLYQHLSGSYPRRVEAMVTTTVAMTYLWISGTRFLVRRDPDPDAKATWRGFFRAARAGLLPRMRDLYGEVPAYFRPAFHPSGHGSTEAALAYLATSPAALAAVAEAS